MGTAIIFLKMFPKSTSQRLGDKSLDHILIFGMLTITRHGKQPHQAGVLNVDADKLHLFET